MTVKETQGYPNLLLNNNSNNVNQSKAKVFFQDERLADMAKLNLAILDVFTEELKSKIPKKLKIKNPDHNLPISTRILNFFSNRSKKMNIFDCEEDLLRKYNILETNNKGKLKFSKWFKSGTKEIAKPRNCTIDKK